MPHIHTRPGEYDVTASAYIVRTDLNEPRLLLHTHKKLGVFMQFGGHVEPHEDPWQAVSHEVLEESGYQLNHLLLLQPPVRIRQLSSVILHPMPVVLITHAFNEAHFHTDIAWAFITEEAPRKAINEGESNKLQLFNRRELLAIPSADIPENVREIGLFILDTCLDEWERVSL